MTAQTATSESNHFDGPDKETDEDRFHIALAMLHAGNGEPFWRFDYAWYLRGRERLSKPHPMEIAEEQRTYGMRRYFLSRADAARAYCRYHALI